MLVSFTDGSGVGAVLRKAFGKRPPTSAPQAMALPVLSLPEFRQVELPERRTLVRWLVEGGLAMAYGPRGVGKTFFGLSLAVALVKAGSFIKWQVQEPVGMLVVYGEMPAAELRECLGALLPDDPVAPLDILSHEIVFDRLERDLNLGRKEWQEAILALREKRPDIRCQRRSKTRPCGGAKVGHFGSVRSLSP